MTDPGNSASQPVGPRPQTIRIATYLMIAGGVLGVVSMVLTFTLIDLRAAIEQRFIDQSAQTGQEIPAGLVEASYSVAVGATVFTGVVGLFFWLWMAWKNWQGRSWARVVATILAAFGVVNFLQGLRWPTTPFLTGLGILNVVVGVGAVVLIWLGDSTEYYQRVRAQRNARDPGANQTQPAAVPDQPRR